MDLYVPRTVSDIFAKDGELAAGLVASFKGFADSIGVYVMCA